VDLWSILEEQKMLGFPRRFPLAAGHSLRDFPSMRDLFREMDEAFGRHALVADRNLDLDIKEDGDNLIVRADVPGARKEDVNVTLEQGVLTISAERKTETEEKDENFHVRERSYGKFTRSIQLPGEIDPNSINATLQDGVLQLILRQREETKPKQIEIK
jgi:HSP20 family protein